MTDQELIKKVAEAIEWGYRHENEEISRGDGIFRCSRCGEYSSATDMPYGNGECLPDWPNDLPACMAPGGPWEWLVEKCMENGFRLVLKFDPATVRLASGFVIPAKKPYLSLSGAFGWFDSDDSLAMLICQAVQEMGLYLKGYAVLAVAETL